MTPEMQFAKSLGLSDGTVVEKTAAAAFNNLSIDELMGVLRADGVETGNFEHVTRTREWRDKPAPELEAHEKTASAVDGTFLKAASIADAWGRKLAQIEFWKESSSENSDRERSKAHGRVGAIIGGVRAAVPGAALGGAAGFATGLASHIKEQGGRGLTDVVDATLGGDRAKQILLDDMWTPDLKKLRRSAGKGALLGALGAGAAGAGLGYAGGRLRDAVARRSAEKRLGKMKNASIEKTALTPLGGMIGGAGRAILNSSAGRRALIGAGAGAIGGAVAGGNDHRLSGALGGAAVGGAGGALAKKGLMAAGSMNNRVGQSIRGNIGKASIGKVTPLAKGVYGPAQGATRSATTGVIDMTSHNAAKQMAVNAHAGNLKTLKVPAAQAPTPAA